MSKKTFWSITAVFLVCISLALLLLPHKSKIKNTASSAVPRTEVIWNAPDTNRLPHDSAGDLIRYGRGLIVHTAVYLGPRGTVAHLSNGMNCDNCHIDGGTLPFANNFSITGATYPEFKKRSNSVVNIVQRINGCFQRSLNGKKLADSSREMKAMVAYIQWVGSSLKGKTKKVFGTGIENIAYLSRAADTAKGKEIFVAQCSTCHGRDGAGRLAEGGKEYLYPPLWGDHSYNNGAGLFRLSSFAGFVKNNMPYGTTYKKPYLSVAQAWDVAAYVNSMPRPAFKGLEKDWPDAAGKPVDYPFGPYSDTFPQMQHKYGPFDRMVSQAAK